MIQGIKTYSSVPKDSIRPITLHDPHSYLYFKIVSSVFSSRYKMLPNTDIVHGYRPETLAVHGDDWLNKGTDVAPALHVSTTYRYVRDPEKLVPEHELPKPESTDFPPVYSRESAPNTTRLEALLSNLLRGHAITYSSGLASFHAMMVYLRPNVVAIGQNRVGGYHGCHGVLALHTKMHGLKLADLHDEASWDQLGLGKGDVVHLETPLNPYGEVYSIQAFAEKAHKRGAYLTVDSTFGPPGLEDPLALGADIVMHSGTKYLGGHSDMLCGVLAVPKERESWFWSFYMSAVVLAASWGIWRAGWACVACVRCTSVYNPRAAIRSTWLAGCMTA